MKKKIFLAIDAGTSSTRVILFDSNFRMMNIAQQPMDLKTYANKPGWVEHDPDEILRKTLHCLEESAAYLAAHCTDCEVVSLGITNQRESTLVWDAETGKSLYPAILWLDTRTEGTVRELLARADFAGNIDALKARCGLPLSTYFSALKMKWLLDHEPYISQQGRPGPAPFCPLHSFPHLHPFEMPQWKAVHVRNAVFCWVPYCTGGNNPFHRWTW